MDSTIPTWINLPALGILLLGGWYVIKLLLARLDAAREEVKDLQKEKDTINENRIKEVKGILENTHGALDRMQASMDSMLRALAGKHDT